jgi:MscS family membrane protein
VRPLLARATSRTSTAWDDAVFARLGAPFTAACTLATTGALLPWLGLYQPAAVASYRGLRAGFLVVFFWALWRLVDVARQVITNTRWARTAASSRSLVPLGSRVAKVVVGAFATVAVLSLLGYPVASLVAGLGLGGLALALAAQKTVENMFGAFSLGVDQPFREGDFVRIEDFVGTVEAIGLRSTRFRTLDRTIVSLPNGKLADMRLESFTARDRMRLATVISLVRGTTAAQMREVLAGLERVLRAHPKIWPDAVVVRLSGIAASSLDIEVMAWFETPEWSEFQLIRQEILLQFMEVVERSGTSFAFPTQTIHLDGSPNGHTHNGAIARSAGAGAAAR